jgi:Tol biopolymer transport system component
LPSALSTANIEIGGLIAGTDHDQATVTGTFTADGTLNIDVINGFTPLLGQTFTVLTYASRTGEFADTTGLSIDASLEFQLNWGATALDLEVVAASPATPSDIVFFSDSNFSGDVGVFAGTSDGSAVAKLGDTGTPINYLITPHWSQDKQRVAFASDASGASNLFVVNSDGSDLTEVVNNINSAYPRWNVDQQHLGFVCRVIGPAVINDICVMPNVTVPIPNIPVNTYTVVTSGMPAAWRNGPPAGAWNPTGALSNQIIFARDSTGIATVSKFFTVNFDGTGLDTITTDIMPGVSGFLRVLEMDVSADGSLIAFIGEDTQNGNDELWVISTDGTGLTQITSPGASFADMNPVFSPDGTEILFGREDDMCEISYWVANSDGSGERELATNAISCESDPNGLFGMDWSPDGSQIVLVGFDPTFGYERVYVVPSDVIPSTYTSVRVPVGRGTDSGLMEGQPNWRP